MYIRGFIPKPPSSGTYMFPHSTYQDSDLREIIERFIQLEKIVYELSLEFINFTEYIESLIPGFDGIISGGTW